MDTITTVSLPDFCREIFRNFGGVRLNQVDTEVAIQQVLDGKIEKLCVGEISLKKHREEWMRVIDSGLADNMVFWIEHPFHFTNEQWQELDERAQGRSIKCLINGVGPTMRNVEMHDLDYGEHVMSHHVCLMLSHMLARERKPTMDFIAMFGRVQDYRQRIADRLARSSLMDNSVFQKFTHGKRVEDIRTQLMNEYPDYQFIHGLGAFGNGFPNMVWYENAWCELVTEVSNNDVFHITEKTWRPIAMGVPVVMLAHKRLYDKLLDAGYRFYDHDFYDTWHLSGASWSDKLDCLEKFLWHLKNMPDRTPVDETARHNYDHFWNHRKNLFYVRAYESMTRCFGRGVFDEIYSRLDI